MRQIIVIVFASIATWVIADYFDFTPRKALDLFKDAPAEAKPVRRSVRPPVTKSDSTPTQQETAATRLETAHRDALRQEAARREASRNRQVLATLMSTCRYWSSQPQDRYATDMRAAACNRARQFAAEKRLDQPSPPRIASVPRNVQRSTAPPAIRSQYEVPVNDCNGRQVGSIEYRQCRARESRRLQDRCRNYRSQLASAGPVAEQTREFARIWCDAADRYEIVK